MKNPGKAKCEVMKEIRKQIAAANDIEYNTRECKFQGECSGTCPLCEQELAYLTEEIRKRKAAGMTVDLDAFKRYQGAQKEMQNQNAVAEVETNAESNTKKKHRALKAAVAAAAATLGISSLSSCFLFSKPAGDVRNPNELIEGKMVCPERDSLENEIMGEAPLDSTEAAICKQKADANQEPAIEKLEGDVPMEIQTNEK